MDSKIHKQLEEARELFYSRRLVEAYNILRRFYDRLPFEHREEHAEYIGMFARVLAELGKENDLKFYLSELERLYEKHRSPGLGYQLGFLYRYLPKPRSEEAKRLFEEVLRNPAATQFHVKSKLMLANYYDEKNDVGTCRQILDSIKEVPDNDTRLLVEIWRAKVLRDEDRLPESEKRLQDLIASLELPRDWYACFSAQLILANLYLRQKKFQEAEVLIVKIRETFENKRFKMMSVQLAGLEKKIAEARHPSELQLKLNDEDATLSYENKNLVLRIDTPSDKLLMLLAKKGFLDKAFIVKNLFQKSYNGESDDKLIYHAVHQARKRLQSVGIPKDAVESIDNGYRFVPKVRILKEVS